jgi:iron complex outermembrane receptor protein
LTIGFVDGAAAEGYHYTDRQFSEEIQASGNLLDRKLKYIGGFYYFHGFEEQRLPLDIVGDLVNPATGAPIPPAADFLRDYSFTTNSEAVYAQVTYSFTNRFHFTAGGRYTHESTYYTPVGADLEGLLGVKPSTLIAAKPSWTVSFDYKPTGSLMIYAANRGSWRSGGFNGTSQNFLPNGAAVAQSFLPETTYDFEIGAKFSGEVASTPASLNIALYDQFINNVIRAIYFNDSANSGNVKAANVRGVEADGSIRPSRWLQLGFSTAYTDARYTQPQASINGTFVIFGPYGDTPAWTGSVYGRISTDLADGGELAARVDYYGQTHFFYSNAAASILPNTEIPGYSLLNLRLEWSKIHGGNISVAAWMKNATDTHYFTGGFALGAVTGINSTLEGEPRMFGMDVTAKF